MEQLDRRNDLSAENRVASAVADEPQVDARRQGLAHAEPFERITFRHVIRSGFRALTDLDFASARTMIGLARHPGSVARKYVDGERGRFVNPVKFAFISSTLFILVNAITTRSQVASLVDPFMSLRGFWPYVLLFLLLPAAGLQRLLFWRRRFNTAECYAFSLFVFGEVGLVGSAALAVQRLASVTLPIWPVLVLAGAYASWAMTDLYQDRHASVWVRGLVTFGLLVSALAGVVYAFQWYRFSGLGG